jgi:hypothetical protein
MGASQYPRKFISTFSTIVSPMHAITTKREEFSLGKEQQ